MGKTWKNILFAVFLCILLWMYGIFLVFLKKAGIISSSLIQPLIFLVPLILALVVIIDALILKKKFPNEKINPIWEGLWTVLFFILEIPYYLSKRDKILARNNQPPIANNYFIVFSAITILLSISFVVGSYFVFKSKNYNDAQKKIISGLSFPLENYNININKNINNINATNIDNKIKIDTDKAYNKCFFLVETSADCQFKTGVFSKNQDQDQDNLLDYVEKKYLNISDTNIDSDKDGVPDGLEIARHSNPQNSNFDPINNEDWPPEYKLNDKDLDGVDSYIENLVGLNANKVDTDNDGVNDGEDIILGKNPFGEEPLQYQAATTEEWYQNYKSKTKE